jgi:hypothetical protein
MNYSTNELFNPAKSMRTNLEIDESIESKILFYREKNYWFYREQKYKRYPR